jgi:hypothetical protein
MVSWCTIFTFHFEILQLYLKNLTHNSFGLQPINYGHYVVITLILLLQNFQGIRCDNVLIFSQLIRQMILKSFKTCLLFHSTCLNFLFS